MNKCSAGLVMYRLAGGHTLEVLLAHPGGPLFQHRDAGVWSIPKGEYPEGEDVLTAAIREFMEETGFPVHPPFIPLGFIVQKSGKVVHAWAFESDADPARAKSNTFTMEWPPHSGRMREFPEIDRVVFFTVEQALDKIKPAQADLITRLAAIVASRRRWARPNLAPGAGPQPRLSATGGQYP